MPFKLVVSCPKSILFSLGHHPFLQLDMKAIFSFYEVRSSIIFLNALFINIEKV